VRAHRRQRVAEVEPPGRRRREAGTDHPPPPMAGA
jgi:hypothetical protein